MEKLVSLTLLFLLTFFALFNLVFMANYPWPNLYLRSPSKDQKISFSPKRGEVNLSILEFSTDKESYSSFEDMYVKITIWSKSYLNNVSVDLIGIKARGYAHINDSRLVTLSPGRNEILFVEKTPYCTSGCGGVYPGPYQIEVKVYYGGKLIANSSKLIQLMPH
ncbi:MAG: hypothetical protein QW507_03370 [Candidatus Nanoarchaeia archaeon]|nr:hypothetical protein [Candidatus Haiyanarchaeum thermophilum]MCW1302879.1 hypothetical protein [Candidatus Haiyanarchaeum thermophilum]MCW1303558.1 hypothetical protein [Candidatus Haiyanarchaeum thermophilum]MCW1306240.1 hypothetical protein [Candidatus Haiyanarchaeum thermophilum]MCW1307524.1 hypothetical protein [Candidatus Haiyanarchaeum thermophilum]